MGTMINLRDKFKPNFWDDLLDTLWDNLDSNVIHKLDNSTDVLDLAALEYLVQWSNTK